MVIERLPDIELNDLPGLLQGFRQLEMFQLHIILDVNLLLLVVLELTQHQPYKTVIVLLLFLGQKFDSPVQVDSVQSGIGLVSICEF